MLTLWIAIVARHMGYAWDTSLTIGKVFAGGLNAQSKGRLLGLYSASDGPSKKQGLGEEYWIHIGDRGIPMKNLAQGARAVVKDKPVDPSSVEKYFAKAFGESLSAVREAMEQLAQTFTPEEIGARAFGLYERSRPEIASGQCGWGQKGRLDLGVVRAPAARPLLHAASSWFIGVVSTSLAGMTSWALHGWMGYSEIVRRNADVNPSCQESSPPSYQGEVC